MRQNAQSILGKALIIRCLDATAMGAIAMAATAMCDLVIAT